MAMRKMVSVAIGGRLAGWRVQLDKSHFIGSAQRRARDDGGGSDQLPHRPSHHRAAISAAATAETLVARGALRAAGTEPVRRSEGSSCLSAPIREHGCFAPALAFYRAGSHVARARLKQAGRQRAD